jgi:putative flippase GtrA
MDVERLARFCTVGLGGVGVNLAVLWLAREHLLAWLKPPGLALNAALALAISLATFNNFLWNRHWTWRDRRAAPMAGATAAPMPGATIQFGQYAIAVAIGSAVQIALTNLLATLVHYLLANALSIAVAAGVNYTLNDMWTFRAHAAR